MSYPPEYGPLAAVTPGTPGGLMVMLAEYGKLSLADVLAPAIQMADGYPIEAQLAEHDRGDKDSSIKEWPYSRAIMLPHLGRSARGAGRRASLPPARSRRHAAQAGRGRAAGARSAGKTRKEAILRRLRPLLQGRHRRRSSCAASQEQGGLITMEDLANWQVHIEEPVKTTLQGHRRLQAQRLDAGARRCCRRSTSSRTLDLKAMGYNSARYIHTLYQAMNLAFADRDFYYGDPYFPPDEPVAGPASKEYAKAARRADRLAEATTRPSSRAIPIRSRAEESVTRTCSQQLAPPAARERRRRSRPERRNRIR